MSALVSRLLRNHRRAAAQYYRAGRIELAARMYQKAGEPLEAARLWLRSGREAEAVAVLEDVHPERAAEVLSSEDRDDLAMRYFERAGSFWKAAECARRLRRPLRAGALFEKAGALEQAASCYGDAGDSARVLSTWQRLSSELGAVGKDDDRKRIDLLRARKLAEQEEFEEAARLLARHGRWQPAARLWARLGKVQQAIEALLQAGASTQAAELLTRPEAADLDPRLRARVLEGVSRHREAASAYEAAGDLSGALQQLEAAGEFAEAARRAEARNQPQRAVDLWVSAGQPQRAAPLVAATGDLRSAARLAREGGDHRAAAEYLLTLGDALRAAEEFIKAGEEELALEALETIEPSHPDRAVAGRLLLPLLVSCGRYDGALRVAAIAEGPSTLSGVYWRARSFEGLDQRVHAIEGYREIVTQRPKFRDAASRLAGLERSSAGGAEPTRGAVRSGVRLQGRYQLEDEIGRGGWSRVYRARDVVRQSPVAVKVMTPHFADLDTADQRLRDEVRLCRRLRHPGIVRVFEHGRAEGRLFIVMEFVEGETLEQRLERGPLSEEQTLDLAEQLSAALATAHREMVLHRDLSAGNVVLGLEGAKIMDFGLALPMEQAKHQQQSDRVFGTPLYMAPEQIRGRALDQRSDLYSLGCVLYAALCGVPPFEGSNATAVSLKHLQDAPQKIRLIRPECGSGLPRIIHRLLAKKPNDRFASAEELASALRAVREQSLQ